LTTLTVLEGAEFPVHPLHTRRRYHVTGNDAVILDGWWTNVKKVTVRPVAKAAKVTARVTKRAVKTVVKSRLGKSITAATVGAAVTLVGGPAAGGAAAAGARKLLNNANDMLQPRKQKVPLPKTLATQSEAPAVSKAVTKAVKKISKPAAKPSSAMPLLVGGGVLAYLLFL